MLTLANQSFSGHGGAGLVADKDKIRSYDSFLPWMVVCLRATARFEHRNLQREAASKIKILNQLYSDGLIFLFLLGKCVVSWIEIYKGSFR